MITSDRMAAIDRNAAALGVPQRQLMEASGNAVGSAVRDLANPGDRIVVVAGRGNNGGDAFAAVRYLDEFDVSVHLLGRAESIATEIARANWAALQSSAYATTEVGDSADLSLPDADLVVDALLGTGIRGPPREPAASAIERINATGATVLAVDVPSGIDPDTGDARGMAVDADHVITFHAQKPGLAELDTAVTVADIGIPPAAESFVGPGDLRSLAREPESHKGDAGRILVIGGGPYTGAPALTAQAALRTGADLVEVACPESIAPTVQGFATDLIVSDWPGDHLTPDAVDELVERSTAADVTVVGPGLGNADDTQRAVREFVRAATGRVVVDADALSVIPDLTTDAALVCTPHRGELVSMGGPSEDDWRARRDAVATFADRLGHTLLVKGHFDVISDGSTTRVSRTGNPGMTVGGTGDVLAGAVAALWAVMDEPVDAAGAGAYVNGLAGDAAADDRGDGLVASDLLEHLPAVIQEARA